MNPREKLLIKTPMAYEGLFAAGKVFHPTDLLAPDGGAREWRVRILTGLIPNMGGRILRHRKRFYLAGGKVRGVNVLCNALYWGYHDVLPGWGRDGRLAMVLDYGVPCNSFLTNHITDVVRTTEDPTLLVGKLYCGDWFGGHFTLERL